MSRWNIRDVAGGFDAARRSALGGAIAALALALTLPAAGQAQIEHVPHAFGDSAANVPLDNGSKQIVNRWVARHTGHLDSLAIQIKVNNTSCLGGSSGYASGTSGVLLATTYAVLPDGRPDRGRKLVSDRFVPCDRYVGGTASVQMGIDVTRGHEYATVVQNDDASPTSNWFSQNFLYQFDGLTGANARNERDPTAPDVHYGLDPRELVGWSVNGGSSWKLPGGPYGHGGGVAFLPTYVQHYTDGYVDGQPYYYPRANDSSATAVYPNVPEDWQIRRLGLYNASSGSGTIVLEVNGAEQARASVSGEGLVSATIPPVNVARGATVSVSASGSLSLPRLSADKTWEDMIGLGSEHRFFHQADPRRAAPVFPIPMYASGSPRPPDGARAFGVDHEARACRPARSAATPGPKKGKVRFTRSQVRTNQRVYAAGIRRARAIEQWLNDGVVSSDLCGGALGADRLSAGITTAFAQQPQLAEATPRPLVIAKPKTKKAAAFRLSKRSLRINRRIALALRNRANGLEARMNGRLTGGDLVPSTLQRNALNAGLRISAATDEAPVAASVTAVAKLPRAPKITRSAKTLRQNQRLAAGAIRTLNRLRGRIDTGLTGEQFAPGSITAASIDRSTVG